jgi:uncharacterized protein
MNNQDILEKTEIQMKELFECSCKCGCVQDCDGTCDCEVDCGQDCNGKCKCDCDTTGHDWAHIDRVRQLSVAIGTDVKADLFIVEMTALLHDIADHKFYGGDYGKAAENSRTFLQQFEMDDTSVEIIVKGVSNVSYSKQAKGLVDYSSLELRVVQDADRLEAIGAIGIARVFAYGGSVSRPIFDPKAESIPSTGGDHSAISHFYDKLFKISWQMNTEIGSRLANERHEFMVSFLKQFYNEWQLKDLKGLMIKPE